MLRLKLFLAGPHLCPAVLHFHKLFPYVRTLFFTLGVRGMGMSHDDDHATCTGHSHIMSGEWVKGRNPSDLSWSSCSRDDLGNFLRSKASACLLHTDPRRRYQVRLPPKLPGMHYSVDEQCQILFGTNATFCNDME
eukprot:superscaffoldBa00004617_g19188